MLFDKPIHQLSTSNNQRKESEQQTGNNTINQQTTVNNQQQKLTNRQLQISTILQYADNDQQSITNNTTNYHSQTRQTNNHQIPTITSKYEIFSKR